MKWKQILQQEDCRGDKQAVQKWNGNDSYEEMFHLTSNQRQANKNKTPFINLQNLLQNMITPDVVKGAGIWANFHLLVM